MRGLSGQSSRPRAPAVAGASRHHRAILGRAVQKGVAGRNLFAGRALKRFVRIFTAEKLFYFRKSDGVGHNGIALHFFTLAKQTVNQLAISAFAQTAQQNQKDQGARP